MRLGSVAPTPPAARAGDTCGTLKAVVKPTTEKPVNASGASQVWSPAICSRKPPAAVPVRMAAKVHISSRPLPTASRSCGINSGRIPYFEGLKSGAMHAHAA